MNELIKAPQVSSYLFPDDGRIPNNPTLPLLVYGSALRLDAGYPGVFCEGVIRANGWGGSWRNANRQSSA